MFLLDRSVFYLNRTNLICVTFCDLPFLVLFYRGNHCSGFTKCFLLSCACLINHSSEIFFFSAEKDGKAFHPTYEEKLKLVALHKQVLLGPYNPDTCPEVGFFDVLGNDRR